MGRCESPDIGDSVGYLAADGIGEGKGRFWRDVLADVFHNLTEFIKRLGSLRVKAYAFVYIQQLGFLQTFYDDSFTLCLPYKSQYLCMSVLAENDDLCFRASFGVVCLMDTLLQF